MKIASAIRTTFIGSVLYSFFGTWTVKIARIWMLAKPTAASTVSQGRMPVRIGRSIPNAPSHSETPIKRINPSGWSFAKDICSLTLATWNVFICPPLNTRWLIILALSIMRSSSWLSWMECDIIQLFSKQHMLIILRLLFLQINHQIVLFVA